MSTLLDLSRTLALIEPLAVRHRSAILRRVQMSGFVVLQVWAIGQLKRSGISKRQNFSRSDVSSWQSIRRCHSRAARQLHAELSLTLTFWARDRWLRCAWGGKTPSRSGRSWWDRKVVHSQDKVRHQVSERFTVIWVTTREMRFTDAWLIPMSNMNCSFSFPTVSRDSQKTFFTLKQSQSRSFLHV